MTFIKKMNKAIFILLTETLIVTKSGRSFPINSGDWKFKTNFYNFFKSAIDNNYLICILDNQFSIGRGTVDEKIFLKKIESICETLERDLSIPKGSILYNYCANEDEEFRALPYPGMLYEVAADNNILLSRSMLICDNPKHLKTFSFGGLNALFSTYQIPYIPLNREEI